MARRTFDVVDIIEILVHWHAGRSNSEIAQSLDVDRKTARKYIAAAETAGMRPGGPAVTEERWAELVREWFPELADTRLRQESWGLALGKPVRRMPGHADWRHWSAGSFTAQTAGVSGVATFLGFGVPLAATASRLPCEQRMRSVSPSLERRPFAGDTGPARKDGADQDTPFLAGPVSARRPGRGKRG